MYNKWGRTGFNFLKKIGPEPDVDRYRLAYLPEPDSVMAAALLCMLMMCMKLCNLCINCSVLMSVIRQVDVVARLKLYC